MKNIIVEKNITIKDIAKLCNLSVGTVSRVINNSNAVSSASREKVNEVINQTGFQPNSVAQSMVSKKSGIVGIVVPEINNPFLSGLVERLQRYLTENRFSIMLCSSGYKYDEIVRFTDNLIQRNAEGVIFVASDMHDENQIARIRQRLSVVLISASFGGFDSVNIADWQSAFEVAEYLISMGHKRIACMGYNEDSLPTMERYRGYCDAMKKHGLALKPEYQMPTDYITDNLHSRGYIMANALLSLSEPPTAIFAINDFYAINAYFAVKEKGLNVGKDISIVGYDDIDICQLVNPALTTVRCQVETLASLAADILIKNMQSGKPADVKSILLTGELIKRESVVNCRED